MWVGQFGCDVKLEVVVVRYNSISKFYHCTPGLLESLKYRKARLVSSCHITSHHITSHHITSHHITSHHITSHHITSHHITSHHITAHTKPPYPTHTTRHTPQHQIISPPHTPIPVSTRLVPMRDQVPPQHFLTNMASQISQHSRDFVRNPYQSV